MKHSIDDLEEKMQLIKAVENPNFDIAKCPFCGRESIIHTFDDDLTPSIRNCRHFDGYDGHFFMFKREKSED